MKKFLLPIVFALFSISIQAQSQNQRIEMQTLVQKVDSLEHELSYLKLTYELNTLNSEITMFANEVYTKSIAIKLDIFERNFNYSLGHSYQRYYESCLYKKQVIYGLIEAKKEFFTLKVITYPYTESELNTLITSYNVIDGIYSTLEHSMNLLKITLDTYQEMM